MPQPRQIISHISPSSSVHRRHKTLSQSSQTFANMKDEPLLSDECRDCLAHEASIRDKEAQITQLKQAILIQYSAEEHDDDDCDKRWLEMVSQEMADLAAAKRAVKQQLD